MQIFVKNLNGSTTTLQVEPAYSVANIKSLIECKEGIPFDEQEIFYAGKHLKNEFTLIDYNIQNASTIQLSLSLLGGAKKRKKKNYTTKKKTKHRHKKVKLAVLKYYKVDDSGKLSRLRRECPSEECGAGVFMAAMYDRQYCGKCGLTYQFKSEDK